MNNSSNVKRVIKLLHDSRREKHVSIQHLCDGICTKSMLEKVELGKRKLNPFYLNRLLARLGIDQKRYEKYLYRAEYDKWKIRNEILDFIDNGDLISAEEMADRFERECGERDKIGLQFCKFVKAQILQCRGTNDNELFRLYQDALLMTVPNAYETEMKKLLLSADEYNLVLECRYRELGESDISEIFEIYEGLIGYIDKIGYEDSIRAKVYPKTIVHLWSFIDKQKEEMDSKYKIYLFFRILEYCDNSIVLLRQNRLFYYLYEVLQIRVEVLGYISNSDIKDDKKQGYRVMLFETEEELKKYKEKCRSLKISPYTLNCSYLYREEGVFCINELVQSRRETMGMTMRALSDNICSDRTISRFETKSCNTHGDIVNELCVRLGITW